MADTIEIKGGTIPEHNLRDEVNFDKKYEINSLINNNGCELFIKKETKLESDLKRTSTKIKSELEEDPVSDAGVGCEIHYFPPELITCKSYTGVYSHNETHVRTDIKKEHELLETIKSEVFPAPDYEWYNNNKDTLNGEEEESSSLESLRTCKERACSDVSTGACSEGKKSVTSIDCEEETIISDTGTSCVVLSSKQTNSNHSGDTTSTLQKSSFILEGKTVFKCTICDRLFSRFFLLKNHYLIIHEGKQLHKCEICDKSFTHKGSLKAHYLLHEGKRPYKCEICDKSYTKKYHLKEHCLIHEGQKPHKCEICGKGFTHKKSLKNHILIHEGKEQYTCEVCNKNFTHKTYLKKHSIIHEDKRSHKCEICGKGFNYKRCLQQHYLTHKGDREHKCEICKKSFTHKSYLQRHILIHEGHRPFKCEICKKDFAYKQCLKDHYLIHEGKKEYKCEVCKRSFRHKCVLKKHYITHNSRR